MVFGGEGQVGEGIGEGDNWGGEEKGSKGWVMEGREKGWREG
jgi:hypothetical protein